jgi:DNA-binding SARP family transcriptional activator
MTRLSSLPLPSCRAKLALPYLPAPKTPAYRCGVSRLEFRVLGPVEVLLDRRPVPVRGRTTLAVLARLLLSANEVVQVDTLIGSIWGSELPAHPRAALHNGVSRLRRLCGSHVETLPSGYRLHATPDQIDLLRFAELIQVAHRASSAAKPEQALAAFDQAVSLWREPPLGNVDSPGLRQEAVPWLTERYLRALEERAELGLLLGRESNLVEQLAGALGHHPFRERMVWQLMVALVRCGRRADSLAAYDSLRRRLSEELGINPSPALQELHLKILRSDGSLELATAPAPGWRMRVP